jgi:hypothetical protein
MSSWVRNTPWWLVSAGIHLVLLLGATLVYLEVLEAAGSDAPFSFTTRTASVYGEFGSLPRLPDLRRAPNFTGDEDEGPGIEERLGKSKDAEAADEACWVGDPTGIPAGGRDGPGVVLCWSYKVLWDAPVPNARPANPRKLDPRSGSRVFSRMPLCRLQIADSAVTAALRWLARHQNADGSWSARDPGGRCSRGSCAGGGADEFDTGVTALVLLAFEGAGYSVFSRDDPTMIDPAFRDQQLHFGESIKRGLQWLLGQQDPEGCIGPRGSKYLYNHAIATLALSEATGMTAIQPLRDPAQKAIDFLMAAQNPRLGWRYSFRPGDNDTSVTGWAVMALKSGESSGLGVSPAAYAGALGWLDLATEPTGLHRVGYTGAGTGRGLIPGRNEAWADHPTMTAIGIASRLFIENRKRDAALTGAGLLTQDLPSWRPGQVDYYYWYSATLALFQADGPGGPAWKKWNEEMKTVLLSGQRNEKHGCGNGSWDPSEDRWGSEGGRVYATAINCLTLEIYYRYANALGVR